MCFILVVIYCCVFFFFFFSSRRRHTRFDCDWSSDVCSSDLAAFQVKSGGDGQRIGIDFDHRVQRGTLLVQPLDSIQIPFGDGSAREASRPGVGRGAWRGRGEISGGGGSFKKKKRRNTECGNE